VAWPPVFTYNGSAGPYYGAALIDAQTAFIVDGSANVQKTVNAGESWSPCTFDSVTPFWERNSCLFMESALVGVVADLDGWVYVTDDGWQTASGYECWDDVNETSVYPCGVAKFGDVIWALDVSVSGTVGRSTDGGSNWLDTLYNDEQGIYGNWLEATMVAVSATECWLAFARNGAEFFDCYLCHTTNGGATWTIVLGPETTPSFDEAGDDYCLLAIDGEDIVWLSMTPRATTHNYGCYFSRNGGATFDSAVIELGELGDLLLCLVAGGDDHFYVGDENGCLWASSWGGDCGIAWECVYDSENAPGNGLVDLVSLDSVAALNGAILAGNGYESIFFGGSGPIPPSTPDAPEIDGRGVEVYDATFELDRKGGFLGASLTVKPPAGVDTLDDRMNSDYILRDPLDGFVLWEGRVADPETVPQGAAQAQLECEGYICALEDDGAFVRNYVDSDLTHWQTRQCTFYADRFNVEVVDSDDDPVLTLYARQDIEIPLDANARAFWYPFGADRGECARIVKFRITADAIGAGD
jgi:hypothetical protein